MNTEEFWARKPFKYNGIPRSRGAIFSLTGMRNDEKLVRLGYVRKMSTHEIEMKVQCGICGQWFIGRPERARHGNQEHSEKEKIIQPTAGSKTEVPAEARLDDSLRGGAEDTSREDAEEARLNATAPLYLENTMASRKAGVGGIEIQTTHFNPEANQALEDANVTGQSQKEEPVTAKEVSPKRNRHKKKTSKKKSPVSKKKTGGKVGRPRKKPIKDDVLEDDKY